MQNWATHSVAIGVCCFSGVAYPPLQAVTNPKSTEKHGRSLLGPTYGKSVTNPNPSQKHGMIALGCLLCFWPRKVSPTQIPVIYTVWSLLGVSCVFDREKCHQPKSQSFIRFGRSWVSVGQTYGKSVTNPNLSQKHRMVALGCLSYNSP
jgi:hypothetical protein